MYDMYQRYHIGQQNLMEKRVGSGIRLSKSDPGPITYLLCSLGNFFFFFLSRPIS